MTMRSLAKTWTKVGTKFLPFADAASAELPLGRLIRLSLFQVSVGMATVLMVGTLNRVMIVELGVSAGLVAAMVSLPLVFAPWRALIGFKSDNHRSALGWRRVPYIWFGTLMQFGGFAFMPFALLVLSGQAEGGPVWLGQVGAAVAFLLVGAGLQTTQTAGLALATDLATEAQRPRVVALMYVMLLVGMVVSGGVFGVVLSTFSEVRLIQVIQAAALLTLLMNCIALWQQEPRGAAHRLAPEDRPDFASTWRDFVGRTKATRFLVAVGLGTAAFSMQDIVLEPYGGEVLRLDVGATSALTALLALGALAAFGLAARALSNGADPYRLAGLGAVAGLPAFAAVSLAAPLDSALLFRAGTVLIGFGGGLFSVGTLSAAMAIEPENRNGLALGAWGAVQATCGGLAVAAGGLLRDGAAALASAGLLGPALTGPAVGYGIVYHVEIALLFGALVAIGPLAGYRRRDRGAERDRFGLAELPG